MRGDGTGNAGAKPHDHVRRQPNLGDGWGVTPVFPSLGESLHRRPSLDLDEVSVALIRWGAEVDAG